MQNQPKDLRFYLTSLQKHAPELYLKIKRKVNLHYEMTALIKKLGASGRDPVVQFMQVSGTEHQIVSNLFASKRVIAISLDCPLEDMNQTYLDRLKNPIAPQIANDGPVKEVVRIGKDADLTSLPVPIHWRYNRPCKRSNAHT